MKWMKVTSSVIDFQLSTEFPFSFLMEIKVAMTFVQQIT